MSRHIIYNTGKTWIVWFEASNQWVQMNNLQVRVFKMYRNGIVTPDAIESLARITGWKRQKCIDFVDNVYDSAHLLDNPVFEIPDPHEHQTIVMEWDAPAVLKHTYQAFGKPFTLVYGSRQLHDYIHPSFAHLEVLNTHDEGNVYHLFPLKERFALRIDRSKGLLTDEAPQLKRLLLVELGSYFHNISPGEWLATLHASAVEKNGKLVLLSSASGSGKSTLAALLLDKGYRFFADDFVPVCAGNQFLYPFPAALTIKKGSRQVVEGLNLKGSMRFGSADYFNPIVQDQFPKPCKASSMVFVSYDKGSPYEFIPVPIDEILLPFMQDNWVSNQYEVASGFMDWFACLSFYRLVYGNNEEAIKAIESI